MSSSKKKSSGPKDPKPRISIYQLHKVIEEEDIEKLKEYIRLEADLGFKDDDNNSPLIWAIDTDNLELVKTLCELGKVKVQTNRTSAVIYALAWRHSKIAKYFIEECPHVDINFCDRKGSGVLSVASEIGDLEFVRWLVEERNAKVNLEGGVKLPLYCSSRNGHVECVKYLLQQGADVNGMHGGKVTALEGAIKHCKLNVVKQLLWRSPVNMKLLTFGPVGSGFGEENRNKMIKYLAKQNSRHFILDLLCGVQYNRLGHPSILISLIRDLGIYKLLFTMLEELPEYNEQEEDEDDVDYTSA
jgi:ankyrin repeat protein